MARLVAAHRVPKAYLYFAGLPACRPIAAGPPAWATRAFLAAGFLAAGFLADLAAGLRGRLLRRRLGLGHGLRGVARERRSIGRASRDEVPVHLRGTSGRSLRGRRRVDGVTGDAAKRAFFFAGAFLAAGLAAGVTADFLAGAGSSSARSS